MTRPAAKGDLWRRIADAPLPPTGAMAAAWAGRQLVVWGGQAVDGHQPAGDGSAYDSAARLNNGTLVLPAPSRGANLLALKGTGSAAPYFHKVRNDAGSAR